MMQPRATSTEGITFECLSSLPKIILAIKPLANRVRPVEINQYSGIRTATPKASNGLGNGPSMAPTAIIVIPNNTWIIAHRMINAE